MKIDIPDVDIEVINREKVVELFPDAIPASQIAGDRQVKHISGLYFQAIPVNPLNGLASLPYEEAEALGYYKVDLLSCPNPYDGIESMDELRSLIAAPIDWNWFIEPRFVSSLFHLNGTVIEELSMADVVAAYAPKSIEDLAALVAIKLPAKRYLIGEPWQTIREQIWQKPKKGVWFKKSHSCSYAMVVTIDAQLKAPGFFGLPVEEDSVVHQILSKGRKVYRLAG